MKKVQLTLVAILLSINVFSQVQTSSSLKVAVTIYDSINQIKIIPFNVLSGDFDVLLIKSEINDKGKSLIISWPSNYIDGRYDLVITPKQVYLRSGHENPNPDHLYWIDEINNEQYDHLIENIFDKYNPGIFEYVKEDFIQKVFYYKGNLSENYSGIEWEDMLYQNFQNLIALLNYRLMEIRNPIEIPNYSSFSSIRPVRIARNRADIENPLNIIRVE